jgi:dTDP-4-amino-4,6-dideoxygalactose transaminase
MVKVKYMSKLAVKGGPAEAAGLEERIPSWGNKKGIKSAIKILESGGDKKELFERAFSKFQDAKYGIAVANGTVSIELALKTLGIGFGDEVIVPAVTFIASASAVTEVGAVPIFSDIDPETAQISSKSLESVITDRTKAAIVVHYCGYPVDFDEILTIAKKHNLHLIEDCAHAHGTEWKGRKVGAIGDMGSFSFQASKSLSSGEGGIVLTNDEDLAKKSRLIHNIGRVVGKPGYMHFILSSNYRITEFQCALLLANLETLPQEVETRDSNGRYLSEKLRKIGGVDPLKRDSRVTKRGYYFFNIRYDPTEFNGLPKKKFMQALEAEGVPVHEGYGLPVYKQPAFKKENLKGIIPKGIETPDYENLYLPASEKFIESEMNLSHEILLVERDDLDLILGSIEKIRENVDELID